MRKILGVAACLAVLAGCLDEGAEITSETVTPKKIRKIDGDRLLSSQVAHVRAYVETDGKSSEVLGARCTLKSEDLSAVLQTPALVKLPTFVQGERFDNRGRPGSLTVTCSANGQSGIASLEAFPFGRENTSTTYNTYSNGNLAGTSTTLVFNSQLSSSFPWSYGGSIKVLLK